MILLGMFTVMILFDMRLRTAAASAIGFVLEPIIGFDFNADGAGDYPILTLMCAGLIMVVISTLVRHYFMDWTEMARNQKKMSAFNKELREARMQGNTLKEKKLREYQSEMMGAQSAQSMNQLKPMVFTMLIAISIFTWLWMLFISKLDPQTISLPWSPYWQLQDNPYILPNWIMLYSLFSIPTGQLLQRTLKYISFKRKLEVTHEDRQQRVTVALEAARSMIDRAQNAGAETSTAEQLLQRAHQALDESAFDRALELAHDAEDEAEHSEHQFEVAEDRIDEAWRVIEKIESEGALVTEAKALMERAQTALDERQYKAVYRNTRDAKASAREAKDSYRVLGARVEDVGALIKSARGRGVGVASARQDLNSAAAALEQGNYSKAKKLLKGIEVELSHAQELRAKVQKTFDETRDRIIEAGDLPIALESTQALYERAKTAFNNEEYTEAQTLFQQVREQVSDAITKYRDCDETISFAKLVIANARDFGGNTSSAEAYLDKAEAAFGRGNYLQAKEFANEAKEAAESAKQMAKGN